MESCTKYSAGVRRQMRSYTKKTVENLMRQKETTKVNGMTVELKMADDTKGAGHIDPRLTEDVAMLARMQLNERQKGEQPSIAVRRSFMCGVNYNLNEVQIHTRYCAIETTAGKVPVWMYYPGRMEGCRPCLLYVHGGAFFGGSVFNVENGCRLLAERADCVVCNIDYSLPPETPYPVPTTQIYEALAYLFRHAGSYRIDPQNMFIGGDSAGGNLAAVAAQMDRDRETYFLKGEVLIYAKLTFTNHLLEGYRRNLGCFELAEEEQQYLEAVTGIGSDLSNAGDAKVYLPDNFRLKVQNLGTDEQRAKALDVTDPYISPAFGVKEGLPKTLMIQAEYDGLRLEGEFYARQLQDAGVPVRLICYRNVTHGFLDKMGILPQAEAAVNEIAAFMLESV